MKETTVYSQTIENDQSLKQTELAHQSRFPAVASQFKVTVLTIIDGLIHMVLKLSNSEDIDSISVRFDVKD
jgi:hypothetical protein